MIVKGKSKKFDIELNLRSKYTVLQGDTASGKTFMYNLLKDFDNNKNIILINYDMVKSEGNYDAMVNVIKNSKNKIIVIDQVDDIQRKNDTIMHAINMDTNSNRFILIGRNPAVTYNISDMCSVNIDNKKITLQYEFPEPLRMM